MGPVRFSLWTRDTCELCERVSQHESRGFPPGILVSSTGNVDRVGWGKPPHWPFHRGCAPWSDTSHKVAARGAIRKLSTRSGWAASFVIQLSSQLQVSQVRVISTPYLLGILSTHKLILRCIVIAGDFQGSTISDNNFVTPGVFPCCPYTRCWQLARFSLYVPFLSTLREGDMTCKYCNIWAVSQRFLSGVEGI